MIYSGYSSLESESILVDCARVARAHNFFVLMGNRYG